MNSNEYISSEPSFVRQVTGSDFKTRLRMDMFRHYRVHCDFRSNSRRLCCNWRPINRDTRSGEGIFPTYLYSFSLTFDYGGVQTTSRIKREPWRIDSLLKDQSRGVPVSLPQPCPLVTHFSTRFKIYDSKSYSMFMYRRNFGHYLCVSSSQALCSIDEAISKAARTTISHWYISASRRPLVGT